MVSEEMVEICAGKVSVLESIYSLETSVGFEVRQASQRLSSFLDLVLLLAHKEEDSSETSFSFQANHVLLKAVKIFK